MGQKTSVTTENLGVPALTSRRTLAAIPCYNEELAIGTVVLQARKFVDEVLVVDDGSTDHTAEVARAAGATVIVHDTNGGKGKGVRTAFQYAREKEFDALVLLDGDGQHDPNEIPILLQPVQGTNGSSKDMALGFRFGNKTEMPAWRRVGKRVLDYATAAASGTEVTDSQCGYRAFNRRAILELDKRFTSKGFAIESEMLVLAKDASLTWENVTIHCKYEGIDGSTKGPVEHAVSVLSSLVQMVTMRRPLITIGIPSVILLLIGLFLGIRTIQLWSWTGTFSMAYALGTATVAIIGSIGLTLALMLNFMLIFEKHVSNNG